MTHSDARHTVSRRAVIIGTGAGALTGAGLGVLGMGLAQGRTATDSITTSDSITPTGPTQAGVARPATPQRNALIAVADVDLDRLAETLPRLGEAILALTTDPSPEVLPDGPTDLTVLVGLGQKALGSLPLGAALTGLVELPPFAGDDALDKDLIGGDLLLSIAASDPGVLEPVLTHLSQQVAGYRPRWVQPGFRGPGEDGVARNPFGFHDGVIMPRGEEELGAEVFLHDGPLAGGTICVMRRFTLDTAGFAELTITEQSKVVGRDKITGAPLSGGTLHDEADVSAKLPNGEFVIAVDSHVRAAHPSFTGSGLMLRRSYNTADDGQRGHVFVAFQNDIRTFVATQHRLDETDAMMTFATPTATAAFAILPGFSASEPLGSTLV